MRHVHVQYIAKACCVHFTSIMSSQLRVFAKYAMKSVNGVLKDVDPDCKGFTLPKSAVEPHTHFLITENTDDSNEVLGQKLFAYMYTLNAIIALLVGAFLLPSLFRIYGNADTNNKTFFENKIKVRFLVVTFLMNTYITLLYAIDIFYHILNLGNINLFVLMKVLYGLTTFGLVITFIICYHFICKDCECYCICNCKGIVKTLLISLLTLALTLLILNLLPFILLLFAHPMNTFALLGIHVALFYTETMAGILITDRLKSCSKYLCDTWCTCTCDWCECKCDRCTCTCDKCTCTCSKCSSRPCTCEHSCKPEESAELRPLLGEQNGNTQPPVQANNTQKNKKIYMYACCKLVKLKIIHCCKILKLICRCKKNWKICCCAIVLFIGSGFVYFSVIIFYQFLFLRNLSSNNLGVDIIIKYLPSIAIGAFGFIIRKGTFSKEDKQEKYWLKLGELLNIKDHEQLDNAKQEKLKTLQSIFVTPANVV